MSHKFPYEWTLKDAVFTKDKGTVFSCFACGGGSTMGYKLAGFDVIGCNEIDPKMIEAYRANHNPKFSYLEPIQEFKLRDDLPEELYNLDILDGSPHCSSFSMAGNREKDWGKEKKFREGQAEQVLDTLFFDFIDLAKKLQPKVVVAENVKGMLLGEAQRYVSDVCDAFDVAGYYVDFTLLDASRMGVPQRRERVFFTAIRKDLYQGSFTDLFGTRPELVLCFNEKGIIIDKILNHNDDEFQGNESALYLDYYEQAKQGDVVGKFEAGCRRLKCGVVSNTITSQGGYIHFHPKLPRQLSKKELCCAGTFPMDYNFNNEKWHYIIGMSVPPVMTAQIATRIYDQWLKVIV